MSQPCTLYLLRLEHNKYYAGATMDPVKTMQQHREGLGPAWTQIHKPIEFKQLIPGSYYDQLNTYVHQMMIEEGIDNVRGGMWQSVRLSDEERLQLREKTDRACCIS